MTEQLLINGRRYRKPKQPTVVICVDGFDPAYFQEGLRNGILPNMASMATDGFSGTADAVVPTFTNPNNASIITGAAPIVHGVSGNYYLDRETGKEVMVTDAHLMRSETIVGAMSHAGIRAAAVTAKDKLRKMLALNLKGINFSSQHADQCTLEENGIENVEQMVGRNKPDMYSPDLSLFVLDAGISLLQQKMVDLLYLSLSDLVQHAHAPGEPEADAFHAAVDQRIGKILSHGAVLGVTADHGMNDKALPNGAPNVVFLEDELNKRFGSGAVRVICPITDPFTKHHGSMGSFVRVYNLNGKDTSDMMKASETLPGIELVLSGKEAAARFELPLDREGDFVVISERNKVIGARQKDHDFAGLAGHRLRSHGGVSEQKVPFLLSHPLNPEYQKIASARRLRNFDIFEFALNSV
jgi:phosphonoacetate hydrolase